MTNESKMEIKIGSEWLSGNSFFPTHEKVTAVISWDRVPAKEKNSWRTIEYWLKDEALFSNRMWIVTKRGGARGITVTPCDVFAGTRFVSHSAMCAAYERSRAKLATGDEV